MASNKKIFLKKITIAVSFSRKKICYKIAKNNTLIFVSKNFVKLHNIPKMLNILCVFSRKKMGFSFFSIDIDNIIFRPRLAFLNNIGTKHIYIFHFSGVCQEKNVKSQLTDNAKTSVKGQILEEKVGQH